MPTPDALSQAVHNEFSTDLSGDELADINCLLDLHRALLSKLSITDPSAAMDTWRRLVGLVKETLTPRFSFEMEPAFPFDLYAQPHSISADEYQRLKRRETAEVLTSFMRGEIDSEVTWYQTHTLDESGVEELQAVARRVQQLVAPYDPYPIAVSLAEWASLRRFIAALRSGLPLQETEVRYRSWDEAEADRQFDFEPFWTTEQWHAYQHLVPEGQVPVAPPPEAVSEETQATRGCDAACLFYVVLIGAVGFAAIATVVVTAHWGWPFLAIPPALVATAFIVDYVLKCYARTHPARTAVMVARATDTEGRVPNGESG